MYNLRNVCGSFALLQYVLLNEFSTTCLIYQVHRKILTIFIINYGNYTDEVPVKRVSIPAPSYLSTTLIAGSVVETVMKRKYQLYEDIIHH